MRSRLEERTSFLSVCMEVFSKTGTFETQSFIARPSFVRFSIWKRHSNQHVRLPRGEFNPIDELNEFGEWSRSKEILMQRCLHGKSVVVSASSDRNITIPLYHVTYSDSCRWEIEICRCSKRKDDSLRELWRFLWTLRSSQAKFVIVRQWSIWWMI